MNDSTRPAASGCRGGRARICDGVRRAVTEFVDHCPSRTESSRTRQPIDRRRWAAPGRRSHSVALAAGWTVFEVAIANRQSHVVARHRLNRRQFTHFLGTASPTHVVMDSAESGWDRGLPWPRRSVSGPGSFTSWPSSFTVWPCPRSFDGRFLRQLVECFRVSDDKALGRTA